MSATAKNKTNNKGVTTMEAHNRYYKNLASEAVTIKFINNEKAQTKFENKLERNEHLVECNKEGVILGSESKDVVQAYMDIATLKKRLEESLKTQVEQQVEIERLNEQINVLQTVQIKPLEEREEPQTNEVVQTLVKKEVDSKIPLKPNNTEVIKKPVAKKKRKPVKRKVVTNK